MAGALEFVPPPLPPIATPVEELWTGPYVGVQAGLGTTQLAFQGTPQVDLSGPVYGVHAGFLYDFGSIVAGIEGDYNLANISGEFDGNAEITELYHAKLRLGYDAGSLLIYGTAGYAYTTIELFDGSSVYSGNGVFYGAGADYMISSNWTAGAEVLLHEFDDLDGSGFGFDLTTVQARVSYHF